jgi:hypothetical protein
MISEQIRSLAVVAVVISAVALGCSVTPGAGSPSTATGSPAATSSSGVPAGFPLGSWTTTITETDLRAGGITGTGELSENAGTFTMTLAGDGTWTVTQDTDAPIRWPVFRGTYTMTGPTSFQQRTEFPPDFAGDLVDFEWRVDQGTLLLEVPNPPDHVLPIVMETHPWQPAG